ncbi:hypothetical protein EU99_0509 [Prochlorococcus marinus str. MIT 9321]|uniref:Uncharacterized protein n=1 Tax=Prochlorococcus marinus str. MIT 9401 TaxID=167551 RepID=A0A0A2B1Q2_PROMR|nr:hypothetical protein EV00_1396 [Prochlorococcus marinus str. MIT 9322]KGG05180.1 hypothetical protein EU99_0509 [Prochlorococcus marinus str. MIT 9321]KGG07047.1 hypothetical protein EV01_1381 [Prochlorococcus marinus str. MIT 9401]
MPLVNNLIGLFLFINLVEDNFTIDVVISGLRHNELLLTIPTTWFSSITPRPFIVSKVFINEGETSS